MLRSNIFCIVPFQSAKGKKDETGQGARDLDHRGQFLAAGNYRNWDPLGWHQGFHQRHGFRERIRAAAFATRAAGGIEGRRPEV